MLLDRRTAILNYPPLQATGTTLFGQTIACPIDRTWPLEEIHIIITATASGTAPTFYSGAAIVTNPMVDTILGILKNANLSINDGTNPRSIVNMSGEGILEYNSRLGTSLSRATRASVAISQGASVTASSSFRIAYRIPLVHPLIGEPLRTRCLIPIHIYPQDPILTLTFANSADFITAGYFSNLTCEVRLIRRQMPSSVTQGILGSGGFIPMDLIETPFSVSTASAGEVFYDLPLGGNYLNLLFRQYLGANGGAITRNVLDQTGIGTTVGTGLGAESRWGLVSGQVTLEEWRWRDLQDVDDFTSYPGYNTSANTYWADPSGAVAANTAWQPAASTLLDFLSDGQDTVNELGSALDCNIPANSGLKMQLHGYITSQSGFTVPSSIYVIGHRLFGDLSGYQAIKF